MTVKEKTGRCAPLVELCRLLVCPTSNIDTQITVGTVSLSNDWVSIAKLASEHSLLCSLYPILSAQGSYARIEDDLLAYLEAVHTLNTDRNTVLLRQIGDIGKAFSHAGIEFAFLKGSALLLHGIYPTTGTRFLRDIDVLVESDAIEDAAGQLAAKGFLIQTHPGAHDLYHATDPSKHVVIELHRSVLPKRLEHIAPTDRFLKDRITAPGTNNCFTPCANDMLLHNAAHAMLHDEYYRLAEVPLKDAYDFALILQHFERSIDIDKLYRWSLASPGDRADPCVMAFYVNSIKYLFDLRFPTQMPQTFEVWATDKRWRARKGVPLDIAAAHEGSRNLFEGIWRYLAVPSDRARAHTALLNPSGYGHYFRKAVEISKRKAGRFT